MQYIFCPHYLTILMAKRGVAFIFCKILAPPPSPDATILTILMTKKGDIIFGRILARQKEGCHYFSTDFGAPPRAPLPDATILNYLDDKERGGGVAPIAISCKKLNI